MKNTSAGLKVIFLMFFVLSVLLFFSVYVISGALMGIDRVKCDVTSPLHPMITNAEFLSTEQFTEEYISLRDKVDGLGPGEKLVNSFFHYFASKEKPPTPRNNILIAVVTTQRYLQTRVQAIYETWASDINPQNKVYFFVGEDCNISHPTLAKLPIVKLKGVRDAVYPPQEKVFAVFSYIHLHFGSNYKWFFRADDDVYIRASKLDSLLDKLDWTEMLYLGQPGYGKREDRERLKLLSHENYCMGGPGVVFSGTTLKSLYPHLDKCLTAVKAYNDKWGHDIGWYNEDVELGRCVSRTLGINCTTFHKVWVI